jgi:hypothetical protein
MRRRQRASTDTPASKTDNRSEAEAAVAAFLAGGGKVQSGPPIEATAFACGECGHAGTIGRAPGKRAYCPRCKTLLSI